MIINDNQLFKKILIISCSPKSKWVILQHLDIKDPVCKALLYNMSEMEYNMHYNYIFISV